MKLSYATPLIIFAALVLAFGFLLLKPQAAGVISQPAPPIDFNLKNKTILLNFYASWCTPCRAEHEQLMTLSKKLPVYGVAYKDSEENIRKYLGELGDPFAKTLMDKDGKTFLDWGLSGVPESFVIKDSMIRYRHKGPVMEHDLETILQLIQKLEKE